MNVSYYSVLSSSTVGQFGLSFPFGELSGDTESTPFSDSFLFFFLDSPFTIYNRAQGALYVSIEKLMCNQIASSNGFSVVTKLQGCLLL